MILEFKDLQKSYAEKEVLKGLSFSVESGRPMAFLGRNGAGKTTTIRILMGVISRNGGEILLDGAPFDPKQLRIGYLPEERGMYQKSKILEQLVYFGQLKGLSASAAKASALELLEKVGLAEYAHKRLEVLSKGNQQKIQLAQALLGDPEMVIMDEPFSGLDPINSKLLMDLILEIKADNRLMLFSSHQMSYVEDICSDLTVLNDGRAAVSGSISELQKKMAENKIFIAPKDIGLADFAGLLEAKGYPSVQDEDKGFLVIDLSDSGQEEFLKTASNLGVTIDSYGLLKPTLSDIFVKYAR